MINLLQNKYLTYPLNFNLLTTVSLNDNINLIDDLDSFYDSLAVFHTSVPNVKLFYPEPFIATPTFVHDDIWFVHIVIYQYWLWFGFVYLIIFFFLAFLITLRWCNIRHRPVRETRGVSRSKCGDLITATVPVSWATSIIIHESTDAIELADGFGTAEMAIGIRAYQWGWEYYYPKDMDLRFYNNKSLLLGNTGFDFLGSTNTNVFNKFKNNLVTADIYDISNTPISFLFNLDYNYELRNIMFSDFTLGVNKLTAKNATSLITSKKLANIQNFVTSETNSNNLISFIKSFTWNDLILSKPEYNKYSVDFLSQKSILFFNSNFLKIDKLNLILKPNTPQYNFNWVSDNWIKTLTKFQSNYNTFFNSVIKLDTLNTNLTISSNIDSNLNTKQITDINNYFSEKNTLYWKLKQAFDFCLIVNNSEIIPFHFFADQDFKRWSAQELIEDLRWFDSVNASDYNYNLQNSNIKNLDIFLLNDLFQTNPYIYIAKHKIFSHQIDYRNLVLNDWLKRSLQNATLQLQYKYKSKSIINFFYNKGLISFSQIDLLSLFSNNLNTDFSISFKADLTFLTSNKMLHSFYNIINKEFDKNNNCLSSCFFQIKDLTPFFKNFTTYYQAFWKVFKSTLDEERTTFNFYNYSNNDFNLPLISSKPSSLISSIQKTQSGESIFLNAFLIKNIISSNSYNFESLNKYHQFTFPFMLSFESDIIRYTWFDWYSLKSLITTKAADTSIFGLNGVRQYEFSFTKDPKSEIINKFDNYFTNYSFARKHFLPSFSYNPFFFNKFRELTPFEIFNKLIFKTSHNLWNLSLFYLNNKLLFLLDNTEINSLLNKNSSLYFNYSTQSSVNHNFFSLCKVVSNKFNLFNMLDDIDSKKKYIFSSLNYKSIESRSNNYSKIWNDIKTLSSNDVKNNHINLNILKFNKLNIYNKENNSNSLKSQYVPLKKGIVNMIRIQADKAVAMPTDTRIQILAVSKDIIHSWSIPSAGIKIDCIPGYSSHRIAMFTVSGIYWGQCMEICGRFHHWMPIVVYFLRRDLFCLWCNHFIFNNKQVNDIYQGLDLKSKDSFLSLSNNFGFWNYKL